MGFWLLVVAVQLCVAAADPPLPNARQLEFMELETTQFMHFNVDTSWQPPNDFLHSGNPTYHNCEYHVTGLSNDSQTEGYWPCLNPKIFNPEKIDTESWMEASAAMGMKEICLTAKHAGGFTMWPSKHTPYGIHSSTDFRGGKGDILKDFVVSAKKWGIKVCYYCNPMTDGYLTQIAKLDEEQYMAAQKGMLTELLEEGSPYGPVHRLWFDGVLNNSTFNGAFRPGYLGDNYSGYYDDVFKLIRKISPSTLIGAQRGDVCANVGSLYTNDGPAANGTNSTSCSAGSETGEYFHPNELHGVTMQEGPDGNTPITPTYWFWVRNILDVT
jgi:alpha-L-fucosidase